LSPFASFSRSAAQARPPRQLLAAAAWSSRHFRPDHQPAPRSRSSLVPSSFPASALPCPSFVHPRTSPRVGVTVWHARASSCTLALHAGRRCSGCGGRGRHAGCATTRCCSLSDAPANRAPTSVARRHRTTAAAVLRAEWPHRCSGATRARSSSSGRTPCARRRADSCVPASGGRAFACRSRASVTSTPTAIRCGRFCNGCLR
jgi:hypothetical protein